MAKRSANSKSVNTKKIDVPDRAKNGNSEIILCVNKPIQPPLKKKYDLVLNNWTDVEYSKIKEYLMGSSAVKRYIVGKEIGEKCGTPHLQCFVEFVAQTRITAIHKIPGFERVSMRECRNEEALITYCKKDGNFIAGGFPRPLKIITELRPWQKRVEELVLTEPDDRTVYWFWEATGNFGKSALVKYLIVKYNVLFCNGGKMSDLMNLVFNNDMDKCRAVVWDLPRGTKGKVSYSSIEAIKNGCVCNTKYETGNKTFNSPHVIVFANYPPDKPEELSDDRWVVEQLDAPVVAGPATPVANNVLLKDDDSDIRRFMMMTGEIDCGTYNTLCDGPVYNVVPGLRPCSPL